mmetsp:Transcript_1775/g.6299  ORF Transcript_1775/g.6299 Transcript_1775/m.6299 type:complete len:315 (-) Transcript_1775:1708-2652(-)
MKRKAPAAADGRSAAGGKPKDKAQRSPEATRTKAKKVAPAAAAPKPKEKETLPKIKPKDVESHLATFVAWLEEYGGKTSDEDRQWMKKYMKYKFDFLGVKSPEKRVALSRLQKECPHLWQCMKDDHEVLKAALRYLWSKPHREYQQIAVDIFTKLLPKTWNDKVSVDLLNLAEEFIVSKSWWDTVDFLAINVVGRLLKPKPKGFRHYFISRSKDWSYSANFWLRRTTLLFQLKYREDTDTALLIELCKYNMESSEFFIRKAIGWALREYAKTDPKMVKDFVEQYDEILSGLSKREALKHVNSRSGPEEDVGAED